MENIDFDRLRSDLIDYYGTAFMTCGFGAALVEASDVYTASEQKLIELANQAGFNLNNYIIKNDKTKKLY